MTRHSITWFEIPALDLDRAQRFYESVLATAMRRETIAGSELAVFKADEEGIAGCLRRSPEAVTPSAEGTRVWGAVWTLAAWCETRQDFRSFRVDRIERLEPLDERFRDEPGKTLPDLLRAVGADRS